MASRLHNRRCALFTALAGAMLMGQCTSTIADEEVADASRSVGSLFAAAAPGPPSTWVASVEALFLWQGNLASRPLLSSFDGVERGPTVLDANQLVPGASSGPRFDLLWRPNRLWSLQVNYFDVSPFGFARSVAGDPELAEEDLAGFSDVGFESASTRGSGNVQSAEFNLRRRRDGSFMMWMVGFRWVQLDQALTIQTSAGAPDPIESTLGSRVGNDLYGGQLGFDAMLWNNMRGPLRVNAVGKAGIYGNRARQSLTYRDSDGFDLQLGDSTTQLSFFGELGMNASIELTRWLAIRAGYTLLWAGAVADPAGQLSVNDFNGDVAGIAAASSLFLHGASVGAELRW